MDKKMERNCSLEAQGCKKMTWVILLVTLFFWIFVVGNVNAFVINTFNNSLSNENLTFTGNQNITRWLSVPSDTFITVAYLNLSGIFPIGISNCSELQNIKNNLTATYVLLNNLDCMGITITPLSGFTGRFFGQGYNISNFSVSGGLFGDSRNFIIRDLGLIKVTASSVRSAGALLASTIDNGGNSLIENVFVFNSTISAGSSGASGAGGLVGLGYSYLIIRKTYVLNTSVFIFSTTSDEFIGGLVGRMVNGEINQSYSNAIITQIGADGIGGLTTYGVPTTVCSDNFWDNETSGISTSDCATGKNTTQMQTQSTYTNWDFTNTWNITTGNYPTLKMNEIYSTSYYPTNPSIFVGNSVGFNSPGDFNLSNVQTNNLANLINNFLSTCSFVNNSCLVPFKFNSISAGILQYSGLQFSNEQIIEVSSNYTNDTYETLNESFEISFSYDSIQFPFIVGSLNYNGVNYTGVKTGSGNNATFTSSFDIPLITSGEVQNNSFYWIITITNSTGFSFTSISSIQNQTVNRIHFNQCGTYNTTAVNFTVYKESNLTRIDPFLFQGTFNVWLGNGNIKRTETINNITVSEMPICIFPTNKQYNTTAEIAYDGATAGQFIPRNYHYNMHIFNSVAQQVPLFLLQPSESTSFILFVRDQNLQAVSGALVFTERYYLGTNTYETVQVGKTGDGGKTVGFFVTETVDYRFRVFVNGEEQLLTTKQKIVGETAPFTITLTIGIQPDNPLVRFDELSQFTGVLQYDNATQLVTFTYQDFTGNLTKARLYVEKINSGTPNTVICNITSSALASTLSCDVSGYPEGTFLAQAFVARSPEFLTKAIQFIKNQIQSIFGNTGLFLAWFLILTAAMVMIWNPTVGIITTNAIIILVNIIGLASFPPLVIFSLIALSVTIIILMKT